VKNILIAISIVAVLALFFVVALRQGPRPPTLAERLDAQHKQAAQQAQIVQWKQALLKNGVMTRIDCQAHEVQADGLAWGLLTVNVKREAVQALSTVCKTETGYGRIAVIHNRSGRKLAEYSGYSAIELY